MLNEDLKRRYCRQMMLPEIGEQGQQRLAKSRVLIVGLGGLGSISSYYLAAAGVGHLRIVDRDCVRLEDLYRQLLHNTDDFGRPKAESASEKLLRLNPACYVQPLIANIGDRNGLSLTKGCDLIIDATDNIETRQALNRVSLQRRIPLIYGGINGWNGMAATFIPGKTGCVACLLSQERAKTSEAVFPALGPTAGVIASIQSVEAIRILLGLPSRLDRSLITFHGLEMRFRSTSIEQDPDCPLCARPQGG